MVWIPILLSGVAALAPIDEGAVTRYTLSFPEPHTHYMEVRATYPTGGLPELDLMMAVWTPGSYLVREYARHLEGVRASAPGGKPLSIEKTRKNRWRVNTDGAAEVVVEYRVYCREMSVRTNWVVSSATSRYRGSRTFISSRIFFSGSRVCNNGLVLSRLVRSTCWLMGARRYTTNPRVFNNSLFSAAPTAPPPVANTILCFELSWSIIRASRIRNPFSPSTSNIQGISAPVEDSISPSESKKSRPSKSASTRPMVVFPTPIGPTRNTFPE